MSGLKRARRQELAKRDERPQLNIIDLSQPPYEVPCPTCFAFALAPCRTERRSLIRMSGVNPPGKVLADPHPARWDHWHAYPQYRVKAMGYKPVRPEVRQRHRLKP